MVWLGKAFSYERENCKMQDAATAGDRKRLGEILVSAGILREENLKQALKAQSESGERLGFILITNNFISEAQLVQALSKQLSIPWVSLSHLDITSELLKMVPVGLVAKFGVIPVYVMSRRPGDKVLYIAMDDPTNKDILEEIAGTSGLEVKPMIAAPSEIRMAIERFYGTSWDTGKRLQESLAVSVPPAEKEPAGETDHAAEPPYEEETATEEAEDAFVLPESAAIEDGWTEEPEGSAGEVVELKEKVKEVMESKEPGEEKTAQASKAVSFTFLDGTSVSFAAIGAKFQKREKNEIEMIKTIGEMVESDHAGPIVSSAIAGILEILLKRGLVTLEEIKSIMEKLEKLK